MTLTKIEQEQIKNTKKSIDKLNKIFGDRILKGSEPTKLQQEVIPCPSPGLSDAVNYWGLPKGKVTQLYGPEGCLDKDTQVNFKIQDSNGRFINGKGGTIQRLYERFHRLKVKGKGKNRQVPENAIFTAPSINEEGAIFHNRIVDVVKTGTKKCIKITTKFGEIITTHDHKFWTGDKFVKAGDLVPNDLVSIHNNTRLTKEIKERISKFEVNVKLHPNGRKKEVYDRKTGNTYTYYRIRRSRAVVEAYLNNLSYDDYITRLNSGNVTGLIWLSPKVHVHHLDEDTTNYSLDNLILLDPKKHNRSHAIEQHNNLRFISVEVPILNIEDAGERETYDIRMESPFNNYVANGFVVHNSGKTFMAMLEVLEAQKLDPTAHQLWLDCEYSLSLEWAELLGIDIDRILHVEENNGAVVFAILCGEPGKTGVLDLVIAGELNVNLVVLDSIAALVAPVEDGRSLADQNIAALARFLPTAFRVATSKLAKSNVAMICINQAREAIGEYKGGLTYPGGRTYRHMCSLNILFDTSLAKKATLYDSQGKKVGHKVNCTVEKTRGGVNRGKTEVWLDFTKGVVNLGEDVATLGVGYGLVERPNNLKWIYKNNEVVGKDNFFAFLEENEELRNTLLEEIKEVKSNGGKISDELVSDLIEPDKDDDNSEE